MNTDAIVNTANQLPIVGAGCDTAVYEAAGREELLKYRKEHIGAVDEGEVLYDRVPIAKVKQMVEKETNKYGWEFISLGVNIDAISEARKFGIAAERAVNYECDSVGTALNFSVVSEVMTKFRKATGKAEACGVLDEGLDDIRDDYSRRHKK